MIDQGWTFDEIRSIVNGRWFIEPEGSSRIPFGASIDTRTIKQGQIFFAFSGERVDGHRFLGDAIERGAALLIVTDEHAIDESINTPTLVVEDAARALTSIAKLWRSRIHASVIAVTGSNGKTTTCRLIDAALRGLGHGSVSQKSFNNHLGVPLTILNAQIDDAYLVCELGTSSHGEIAQRVEECRPNVAVITSIGRAHLQELGSRDGIIREKSSIARGADLVVMPSGIDGLIDAVRAHTPGRIIEVDGEIGSGWCVVDGERFEIGLPGLHNARNASLAVTVARALGADVASIREHLKHADGPPMRLQRVIVETNDAPIVVINDAYNANPDSMRASIKVLSEMETQGRRVAVLGDMLELGAVSQDEHRSLMHELESNDAIDLVVCFGDAFASVSNTHTRIVVVDAISEIAPMIEPKDLVLLKGSRGMRVERVFDALQGRFSAHASHKG